MKFRPRIQLQVRSIEQYDSIKEIAEKESASVNEWILRVIEEARPGLKEAESSASVAVVAPKVRAKAKR